MDFIIDFIVKLASENKELAVLFTLILSPVATRLILYQKKPPLTISPQDICTGSFDGQFCNDIFRFALQKTLNVTGYKLLSKIRSRCDELRIDSCSGSYTILDGIIIDSIDFVKNEMSDTKLTNRLYSKKHQKEIRILFDGIKTMIKKNKDTEPKSVFFSRVESEIFARISNYMRR